MPGQIRPVELGVNPLRLHCLLKATLSQWIYTIYTQFDQKFMPGQIGSKSIEIDASWIHWDDTQFDQGGIQCNLSEFTPILTSNSCPVELGVNPLRLHCLLKAILSQWIYTIYTQFDQKFMPSRIGSKSIEIDASWIHWDDTQFDQGGIQCNLSERSNWV